MSVTKVTVAVRTRTTASAQIVVVSNYVNITLMVHPKVKRPEMPMMGLSSRQPNPRGTVLRPKVV